MKTIQSISVSLICLATLCCHLVVSGQEFPTTCFYAPYLDGEQLNDSTVALVGLYGGVTVTRNGGASWVSRPSISGFHFRDAQRLNDSTCLLLDTKGRILISTDGLNSFSSYDTTSFIGKGVLKLNTDRWGRVYANGANGFIAIKESRNGPWQTIQAPSGNRVWRTQRVSADTIYALSGGCALFRSIDRGATWLNVFELFTGDLFDYKTIDADSALILGVVGGLPSLIVTGDNWLSYKIHSLDRGAFPTSPNSSFGPDDQLFSAYREGVSVSRDRGTSWARCRAFNDEGLMLTTGGLFLKSGDLIVYGLGGLIVHYPWSTLESPDTIHIDPAIGIVRALNVVTSAIPLPEDQILVANLDVLGLGFLTQFDLNYALPVHRPKRVSRLRGRLQALRNGAAMLNTLPSVIYHWKQGDTVVNQYPLQLNLEDRGMLVSSQDSSQLILCFPDTVSKSFVFLKSYNAGLTWDTTFQTPTLISGRRFGDKQELHVVGDKLVLATWPNGADTQSPIDSMVVKAYSLSGLELTARWFPANTKIVRISDGPLCLIYGDSTLTSLAKETEEWSESRTRSFATWRKSQRAGQVTTQLWYSFHYDSALVLSLSVDRGSSWTSFSLFQRHSFEDDDMRFSGAWSNISDTSLTVVVARQRETAVLKIPIGGLDIVRNALATGVDIPPTWARGNQYLMMDSKPNPASSVITLTIYGLHSVKDQFLRVSLCDVSGSELRDLTAEVRAASNGSYSQSEISLPSLPAGVYFVNVQAGLYTMAHKMMVIQ